MKTIKHLIALILYIIPLLSYSQLDKISTFATDASIGMQQSCPAEVAACIDSNFNTHIAWIQTVGNNTRLMYSMYNNKTISTQTIDSSKLAFITAPAIAVDNNQAVHIVYMIKREHDNALHSGNYAIRYATNNNYAETFQVEQVSTNVSNAESNPSQPLDCYVNDRPQIAICGGMPAIFYISNAYRENNWNNRLIAAHKKQKKWNYRILSQMSGLSVNSGYEMLTSYENHDCQPVFINLKNNQPSVFNNRKQSNTLQNKKQKANNSNIRTVNNENGTEHIIWLANSSQDAAFCCITNNKNGCNKTDTIFLNQVPKKLQTDATMDIHTGIFFGIYQTPADSCNLVISDFNSFNLELAIGTGKIHGKQCLNAHRGFVSIVTACTKNNKLFITTCRTHFKQKSNLNSVKTTNTENSTTGFGEQNFDKQKHQHSNITIFPNPASDGFYFSNSKTIDSRLQQIRMYELSGKLLHTYKIHNPISATVSNHIPLENYQNGIYFVHFVFNDRSEMQKLVIEH